MSSHGTIEPTNTRARSATPVLLVLWTAALASATLFAPDRRGDLEFFVGAYRSMVGDAGLHVYAELPNIQSGPLALVAVGLLDQWGTAAFPLAVAATYAVAIAALVRLPEVADRSPVTVVVGGLALLFWWRTFAFQGHLDDATVVALALVALVAVRRDRRVAAAVVLGVALAVKPWSLFLLPMTLRTDGPWSRRLAGPFVSVIVGGILWSPFVLATPDTLDGIRPTVWNAPDSVARLVTGAAAPLPASMRVVQLLVCLGAVAWITMRGHVTAALFLGVAVRLLLDGGTWPYYTAGLVAGALVIDLVHRRSTIPWTVAATTLLLPKPGWLDQPDLRAALRAVACLAAIGLVVRIALGPSRRVEAPTDPIADQGSEHPLGTAEFV